ncbi:MAG: hypothetical protein ACE5JX_06470 [Acidobacteriota bacterium]
MVDIPRKGVIRRRRIKQAFLLLGAVVALGIITVGLSRLEPAAPTVDAATVWMGEVKRGEMIRQVRGPGTLVPEQIWWVPAITEGRVERILVKPGRQVTADTVLLELSNPQLQLDTLEAEWQVKKAEANYRDLKVRLESQVLDQQASAASVKADYEEARLRASRDAELAAAALLSEIDYRLSKVRSEELATRNALELKRLAISED